MNEQKPVKEVEVPAPEKEPRWVIPFVVAVAATVVGMFTAVGYERGVYDGRRDLRQEQHAADNWSYGDGFSRVHDAATPLYLGIDGTTCPNDKSLWWNGAFWQCTSHLLAVFPGSTALTSNSVIDNVAQYNIVESYDASFSIDTAHAKVTVDGHEIDVKRLAHDYAKHHRRARGRRR